MASLRHDHLRLPAHAGVIARARADTVLEAFDEVRAMTSRLVNPRTRSFDSAPRRGLAQDDKNVWSNSRRELIALGTQR